MRGWGEGEERGQGRGGERGGTEGEGRGPSFLGDGGKKEVRKEGGRGKERRREAKEGRKEG